MCLIPFLSGGAAAMGCLGYAAYRFHGAVAKVNAIYREEGNECDLWSDHKLQFRLFYDRDFKFILKEDSTVLSAAKEEMLLRRDRAWQAFAVGIACVLVGSILAVVCSFRSLQMKSATVPASRSDAKVEQVRTNSEPILSRLPKLRDSALRAWWISSQTSIESVLSPPVNPVYRLQGFVEIKKEKAEEFALRFKWDQAPASWSPENIAGDMDFQSTDWSSSASFDSEIKPTNLPGRLFFSKAKNAIYFDLETE
jgi:hypothetical protein